MAEYKALELTESLQRTEAEAQKVLQKIIRRCENKTVFFIDNANPQFYLDVLNPLKWQRPRHELMRDKDSQWTLYRSILPSDIKQGCLGNCWLLSALAALATRPELVINLFVTKETCPQGVYQVRLYIEGEWTIVTIDDQLPCDHLNFLRYSKVTRNQLWVPLIEKAVAKIHGCYEALDGGHPIEGLAMFTGSPCETIRLQKLDNLEKNLIWEQLKSAYFLKYLMCAATSAWKNFHSKGLVPNHSYSLLCVKHIQGHRLLKLRNPYGIDSWLGDWSDHSKLWTDELKYELRDDCMPDGNSEGVFWISFEDFLIYFHYIQICKVRSDWYENRLKVTHPLRSLCCALLTVTEPTLTEFTLFRRNQRNFEKVKPLLDSQDELHLAIFEIQNLENLEIGRSVGHSARNSWICGFVNFRKMMDRGLYLVACLSFSDWLITRHSAGPANAYQRLEDTSQSSEFLLTIHSCKPVLLQHLAVPLTMLADAIINLTIENGNRYADNGVISYILTVKEGWYDEFDSGRIIMVENKDENRWIKVVCDFPGSPDLASTRGACLTIDFVPPLHRQVINVVSQKADVIYEQKNIWVNHCWYIPHNPLIYPSAIHSPRPITSYH